jgi:hypothetical protein
MTRKIASAVFLVLGVMIVLGAYGHGFMGRRNIDAELDKFAIATGIYTMLYVVWYFVSGCMLLFGITIIVSWFRLRRGQRDTLLVVYMIGALYFATGVGGMIYRHGDRFMSVFIIEGALLLASSYVLHKPAGVDVPATKGSSRMGSGRLRQG